MIKLVASLVASTHKVDLTKPDKVIIVEIYQVSTRHCFLALLCLTNNLHFRRPSFHVMCASSHSLPARFDTFSSCIEACTAANTIGRHQTICGMSIVDSTEWENLKRFNLAEIYQPSAKAVPKGAAVSSKVEATATPEMSSANEERSHEAETTEISQAS